MTRLRTAVAIFGLLVFSPTAAKADVVLDWNAIAVTTLISRRVVRDEVLLPVLATRDGDSRGRSGWQCENGPRRHLCAVHSHAVFSRLSVESRERKQQRGRDPEASRRCGRPCHNDGQPRRAGHNTALHDVQSNYGRYRRRQRPDRIENGFLHRRARRLGRDIATFIYKHNLRGVHKDDAEDEN